MQTIDTLEAKIAKNPKPQRSEKTVSMTRAEKKAETLRMQKEEWEKRNAAFAANKTNVWFRLWAGAMQLSILIEQDGLLREGQGNLYWFKNLAVGVAPGEEFLEHDALNGRVTLENMTLESAEMTEALIVQIQEARSEKLAEREALRVEIERIALVRKNAMNKLDDEERKALGLK